MNSRYLNAGVFIIIILFMLALYSVPLQSRNFYFDDSSVVGNKAVKAFDVPGIFNAFNTRFLAGLSFAVNYRWCAAHPSGYRITNLLIHCFNAFLVFLLIKSTLYLCLTRQLIKEDALKCPLFTSRWPALFGAMLFLCHPVQTEAVNFIFQRFVLMGTFFYLLTVYMYIQYRCRSQKRFLIASMGCAAAAMFCKEFVVTLPIMLVLYEFYFLGASAEPWRKSCGRILPFFVITLIVPILLLRTPPQAIWVANIAASDTDHHIDITRARHSISRRQYFLTELNVVRTYVRLMFLPVNQNVDYDYPLSHGDVKDFLSGLFLLVLIAAAVITFRPYRIVSFGILWFLTALSVESSIIPIGNVICEYRLYLASVGFVFLVMTFIYTRRLEARKLNIIAAAVLAGCCALTFQRNEVWKDEFTFWNDAVRKSPQKARQHYTLGFAYFYQGKFNEAVPDFNKAIEIKPDYVEDYVNLGIIYTQEGRLDEALLDLDKAIQINPGVAGAYYNRGNVYLKQNNIAQALQDYYKAIGINPYYAEAYTNLGGIYDKQGNYPLALSDFNKAIALFSHVMYPTDLEVWIDGLKKSSPADVSSSHDINYADAYFDRGCVYDKLGSLDQAVSDYSMAIKINPDFADTYNNRGHIYSRQGRYTQALADYDKAIEINPNVAGYYYNRAISYFKTGQYVKAAADLRRAEKPGAE